MSVLYTNSVNCCCYPGSNCTIKKNVKQIFAELLKASWMCLNFVFVILESTELYFDTFLCALLMTGNIEAIGGNSVGKG